VPLPPVSESQPTNFARRRPRPRPAHVLCKAPPSSARALGESCPFIPSLFSIHNNSGRVIVKHNRTLVAPDDEDFRSAFPCNHHP